MTDGAFKVVNLTPHTLNVVDAFGNVNVFQPSGKVARVAVTRKKDGNINSMMLHVPTFGDVQDLPDPQQGTCFVVSAMVRNAVLDRWDVVSPGPLLRDADGNVTGCDGFDSNPL